MREPGIKICDTTLRDGEQAPGVAFSPQKKLALARLIDGAGAAEIEAGTPVCGGGEFEAVRLIAGAGLKAKVAAWCRAREEDIRAAKSTGVTSVAIAVPSSVIHLGSKMGKTTDWAVERTIETVRMAVSLGMGAIAAFEDASRADLDTLGMLIRAAVGAGAERVRVSDTVGVLDPSGTAELVKFAALMARGPVEFHGHNDYGLATANTLAAAGAGATHLSVTVLGIGERAGNAPLEEVALGVERFLGLDPGIDLERLPELFRALSVATGRFIPPGKPVAGSAAFTHESGIHVDGVLKNPANYEPFSPEKVGARRRITLGKHSGSNAVAAKLRLLGVPFDGRSVEDLLAKVRVAAVEKGRGICDSELLAMAEGGETV